MPEGDTVWRAARLLDQRLGGAVLRAADLRVPALAGVDLAGWTVTGTVAAGKHLLTRLRPPGGSSEPPATLHTHLRMEGAWRVLRHGERWPRPAHQARVVLRTEHWQAVGFSLGVVELLPTRDEADVVGHLGPDLLGTGWDDDAAAEAVQRLRRDPDAPLVAALLDQRNLAGIGNMYAAELAFTAGRHPLTPVSALPPAELRRLVDRARRMLLLNKERPVQSTTGDLRAGERTWVYRRDRRPCRRCGTPVAVAMRDDHDGGGRLRGERATYWCPRCQPGP